jgi:hypothetical protein
MYKFLQILWYVPYFYTHQALNWCTTHQFRKIFTDVEFFIPKFVKYKKSKTLEFERATTYVNHWCRNLADDEA